MVGRHECTAKRGTPSGPAEYDEETEEMIWDTISVEMVEKQKIGWEVNGIISARSKSVALQVTEARDISTKNEFTSSGEKKIRGEDRAGLTRPKLANSLYNIATSVILLSLCK